jgi:D-amino-acid dehydrogenase
MSAARRSVAVIGGGVVGLSCAYQLRRHGADVTVLERGRTGRGASWGNAGWVCPTLSAPVPAPGVTAFALRSLLQPHSPLRISPRQLLPLAPWLWRFVRSSSAPVHLAGLTATARLAASAPADFDALRCDGVDGAMCDSGLLYTFLDADHARAHLEELEPLRALGQRLPHTVMLAGAARRFEPALGDGVAAAFLAQDERHVDPGALTAELTARIVAMGVDMRPGTDVGRIVLHGKSWCVRTRGGDVVADDVVVAAGAWSAKLVRDLGVRLPLVSGKGYSFSIRPPLMPRRPLYLTEAKVGCTPIAGRMRIAGTMELAGLDASVAARRIDAIARSAQRFLASPVQPRSDEWAGLRPMVPDGLPVIGPAGPAGLWLATAHSMLGVTLGPTTGRVLAEWMMLGRPSIALDAFSPSRFVSARRSRGAAVVAEHP